MQETVARWLSDPVFGKLIVSAIVIVIAIIAVRIANRGAARLIEDNEARYRVRKLITLLAYLVVLVTIAVVFSSQFRTLTVALGVAGAGIAFALQEVIASVAGWIAVLFGTFFRVGDRVQLGGIRGDVIDIGVLRTTLMECGQWVNGDLYNGRIVRVANSFVFKEPVFNYSADFPFLWDEFTVPIRYGSDYRLAREIVLRILHDEVGEYAEQAKQSWRRVVTKYRIENARVDPMVTLVANDNWIEFTARYVVDYTRRRATKDRLFTRLLDDIDATAGKVLLASATFELVDAPAVNVRLLEGAPER